jgi:hypothetical protein
MGYYIRNKNKHKKVKSDLVIKYAVYSVEKIINNNEIKIKIKELNIFSYRALQTT